MKNHPVKVPAKELPIYDRAVARYPHLVYVRDAFHFCRSLCDLAAVPGITMQEYAKVAAVAQGMMWPDTNNSMEARDE